MRIQHAVFAILPVALAPCIEAAPGTEFWAELSSQEGSFYDFTIAVGNPDPSNSANIVIETESGPVATGTVPPLATARFDFPYDRQASRSILAKLAYRVRSDRPVHAYQWFGFDPRGTLSAAILIDRQHWGREYYVLAATADAFDNRQSLVTVVAAGPSTVEVVPAADTQAGPGVPALSAGVSAFFDLDAFDVLQIASFANGDLTGTHIRSSAPVEVFAGCETCLVPGTTADQAQEWMLPVALWSKRYIAASSSRITGSANAWRILASEDGTSVTTDPPQPGTPVVLDRGGWVEIISAADFEVESTRPILVGRYMSVPSLTSTDPALSLVLPPEYFAFGAIFPLSNRNLVISNWLDIVAPPGASVTVDGNLIPAASFTPIGPGAFQHAAVALDVTIITHSVVSDVPIGIDVGVGAGGNGATFPTAIQLPVNLAPLCDAGGPYTVSCQGPVSRLRLSGSASSDPESFPLGYTWSAAAPSLSFDDVSRVDPELTVTGIGTFTIDLEVSDGFNTTLCSAQVTVTGTATTPPELDRFATPLWLARRGADVLFSWQDLGGSEMLYNIYEGALGTYWSHVPSRCGELGSPVAGGRREAVLTPGAGSRYFQVSAANCFAEGPSGSDPALSTCPP